MGRSTVCLTTTWLVAAAAMLPLSAEVPQIAAPQQINLAEWMAGGKLRAVNRDVTALEGDKRGIKVSEKAGPGVVWIEGSDFEAIDASSLMVSPNSGQARS